MARVNVYLPDELAEQVRKAGLNVSQLTQDALRRELAGHRTSTWLDQTLALPPTGVSDDQVVAAVAAAREEMGSRGG